MPLLGKKWAEGCQPRALFHQGQKPSRREWTVLGLKDTYLGNAGFPGLSEGFSNGARRDLKELNTNKKGRDWGRHLGRVGHQCPPVRLRPLLPSDHGTAPLLQACSSALERGHFCSSPASHLLLMAHLVPNRSFSIPNLWLTRLLKSCSALPKPNRILYDILGKGGVWSSL